MWESDKIRKVVTEQKGTAVEGAKATDLHSKQALNTEGGGACLGQFVWFYQMEFEVHAGHPGERCVVLCAKCL